MTREELLEAGFESFPPPRSAGYAELFQSSVRDERGVRYYVDVHRWERAGGNSWEAEVRFNDGCEWHPKACLAVQAYSVSEWTADEVLSWARELWGRLNPHSG